MAAIVLTDLHLKRTNGLFNLAGDIRDPAVRRGGSMELQWRAEGQNGVLPPKEPLRHVQPALRAVEIDRMDRRLGFQRQNADAWLKRQQFGRGLDFSFGKNAEHLAIFD